MTTYSLTAQAEAIVHRLAFAGGTDTLRLERNRDTLRAALCVEQLGATLEAVVSIGGTTSSMTLQADDDANGQHLCDYIEALANGTAETAAEAPNPAPRCCGDCDELRDEMDTSTAAAEHPLLRPAQPVLPEAGYFTLTFQQDAKLRRLICEGGETALPLGEGAALAVVVDPDQAATWQARIRTPDADLQVRLPAEPGRAHQNLIEHVERMAEAYRWTREPLAA